LGHAAIAPMTEPIKMPGNAYPLEHHSNPMIANIGNPMMNRSKSLIEAIRQMQCTPTTALLLFLLVWSKERAEEFRHEDEAAWS
jgi:hypothetical protein